MKASIIPTSVLLVLYAHFPPFVNANTLLIGDYDSSSFEVVDPVGTSTITFSYDVNGATVGNNAGASADFYIKHEMLAKGCGSAYTGSAPVTLSTDPDATTVDEKVTSALTNTATWADPDIYEFCLQYTLYMLGPSTPFEWQVKGFDIKVDVNTGGLTATTTQAVDTVFEANAEITDDTAAVAKAGDPPTLSSVVVDTDGEVEYQEEFKITWLYVHAMDFYDYTVDSANILLIDPYTDEQVEYPAGTPVTLADLGGSVSYTETGYFGSSLGGEITLTTPLKVFQFDLPILKIQFTVQYDLKSGLSNPARRHLGENSDETWYLKSGTFNEVISVRIRPASLLLQEDISATIGYKFQIVFVIGFVGAAAALLMSRCLENKVLPHLESKEELNLTSKDVSCPQTKQPKEDSQRLKI